MQPLPRQSTHRIRVGAVEIGGGAPVSVQTMANTDTRDAAASAAQALACFEAGADIVRFAVPDAAAAAALAEIKRAVGPRAIVADIHFDHRLALAALEAAAAKDRGVPIRIGVNAGSLEKDVLARHGGATPEALVESALGEIALLEDAGFGDIKVSVKASDVPRMVAAYRLLSARTRHPLHLGLTEAGTLLRGTVSSSVALGILLAEGIGDTIRVSLTDAPENEVRVGLAVLRSLGLRAPGPDVTSCPTCGRTQCDLIGTARRVEDALERLYRAEPALPRPRVAVMGCVVNGPGEARDADLALVGGRNTFFLFARGERLAQFPQEEAVDRLVAAVRAWEGPRRG